jgi:DNA-binding CsgD family transcriptional regulator
LLGDTARARGDWGRARELLAESSRLTSVEGTPVSMARAVYFSARLEEAEGGKAAGKMYAKALSLGRMADAPGFHEARCLLGTGTTAQADTDDDGTATGRLLEALELAQAIGDTWSSAEALDRLSLLARLKGRGDEADTLARRGLELHHQIGDVAGIASSLESLAGLAVDGERWELAARLFATAQTVLDNVGYARPRPDQARQKCDLDHVRAAMGKGFSAAWDEGASLSADEAVTYAMRGRGARGRPAKGWDSLTPAERQVVTLVGEGLTNPEVGRRLFVSPRTVGHHLAHVYQKLGIHSRGALIKELAAIDTE